MEYDILSIEEQLTVLRRVQRRLKTNDYSGSAGLCYLFSLTARDIFKNKLLLNFYDKGKSMPIFTFDNAVIACRKAKVKLPLKNDYWWDLTTIETKYNKRSRMAFVSWMINELS